MRDAILSLLAQELVPILRQALAQIAQEQRQPVFYTETEAAAILRVQKRTVQQWCAQGELEHVRIGSLRRIPAAALERMAKGEKSGG